MSSNESTSSDQEHIDAEELNQDEGQSASTSRELMPTNSRELTSSQDVSGGQFGERIITGEVALPGMGAGTTMTGPVENKIDGGDFYGATLGPVTHRNKIITHHEQKSTHIGKIEHIHYHGSNRSDLHHAVCASTIITAKKRPETNSDSGLGCLRPFRTLK